MKKKREKAEDFIGWKSEDGKLEVIGIAGKTKGGNAVFKVTCTECSKDKELFPDGYFVSTKGNLLSGQIPCGCAKGTQWKPFQYLILAHRASKGRFTVHGFAEEFKSAHTKLNLECLKDGYKWSTTIHSVISGGKGCPKCYGNARITEQEALQKCTDICKEMNYEVIGFVGGYKNSKSHFEYECQKHGKQDTRYDHFIHGGVRCGGCARDLGNANGYFPERKDEIDFLYVLSFDNRFIKVGRSFDVEQRIKKLRTASKIPKKKIYKLRIFTATHQEVYDLEQDLHNELRERNFQHYVDWSTECFENDCQFVLNNLLDNCGLAEIEIRG